VDKFAKLFETKKHGQILVVIDEGDEGPEVRVSFTPPGMGVCSVALKFSQENEDGWDKAKNAFDLMTEVKAVDAIKPALDIVSGSGLGR
jgi:hypothetical protein